MSHTDKAPWKPSRREFFAAGGALAAGSVASGETSAPDVIMQDPGDEAPTDDITMRTLAEAEKIAGVEFTPAEREVILGSIRGNVEMFRARRVFEPPNWLSPATVFDPRLPGVAYDIEPKFVRSKSDPGPLPASDVDIAYAPVTKLSRWIERGDLSSERLTRIYLDRIRKHGPKLECIVTVTEKLALAQAKRADEEIAAGRYRGPLHGMPWGAKDLLDTKGVRTSWGAMPYRDRIAETDAAVVKMVEDAGAVLVAKTTLGALAYGDIWFGGRTNNPWNPEQGSSGSSAGSAAGTAAGLYAFSIGTETLGSIVSPCMRCGTTGLRPTFGRVPRTGAMALCWSLDKIGPICRTVEDCALVLNAINGRDPGDASSLDVPLSFDAMRAVKGLRAGYDPRWLEGRRVSDIDRKCISVANRLGLELVEIELPDLPYSFLRTILSVEAATAFEELTLSNRDDMLRWQSPRAWPNSFRTERFTPAIEFLQAGRFRRHVMQVMHEVFVTNDLDVMLGPSYAGPMLLVTNNTGHPSVTIRAGFYDNGSPHGFTVWGRLFEEGPMCNVAAAMECELGVWHKRPPEFS